MIPPVVDQAWLAAHPEAVRADVRWYLDGRSGADAFASGHLPGAVFVDLDTALAASPSPEAGRHPLPAPEVFAEAMAAVGIGDDAVVVAYDDAGGASAARLVWLLRMLDVDAAVLDGGIAGWTGELSVEASAPARGSFTPRPWPADALVDIEAAAAGPVVVDARAPERYRGEVEPVDPRAGHIPGAINIPFSGNLTDGWFRSPEELRARFAWHGITDAAGVIVSCGSGVTACHDLVAMEHAGLGRARLFPGSWSQWAHSGRPVATGPEPGARSVG